MADEPDNLVLEHLRALRSAMSRLEDKVDTMSVEVTAMRQIMTGAVLMQQHDHTDIAVIKSRLDRIERRLDLVE